MVHFIFHISVRIYLLIFSTNKFQWIPNLKWNAKSKALLRHFFSKHRKRLHQPEHHQRLEKYIAELALATGQHKVECRNRFRILQNATKNLISNRYVSRSIPRFSWNYVLFIQETECNRDDVCMRFGEPGNMRGNITKDIIISLLNSRIRLKMKQIYQEHRMQLQKQSHSLKGAQKLDRQHYDGHSIKQKNNKCIFILDIPTIRNRI